MKDSHAIFRVYSLANTVEECFWEVFSFWVNYSFKDLFMCVCVCTWISQPENLLPALHSLLCVLCVFFRGAQKQISPAQCQIHPVRSGNSSSSDGESGLHQQLCRPLFSSIHTFPIPRVFFEVTIITDSTETLYHET